ncbi:MAG: sialate O-acetylesterase [Kiritimatiellales bacterium]
MRKLIKMAVFLAASMFWTIAVADTLKLGAPFSDHMVLQCDKPVVIWGSADSGSAVTVTLGTESLECKTAENGKWKASLSAREASFSPVVLRVSTGTQEKICSDILVGAVWYCSGQSNMGRRLKDTTDAKIYAAQANLPHVRFAEIPIISKSEPQDMVETSWKIWTPDSVLALSGTAFHFGKKLAEEINKPIGLISCSWGGSKIQAWIPREYFEKDPAYTAGMNRLEQSAAKYASDLNLWEANGSKGEAPKDDSLNPKVIPCGMDNGMTHPLLPYAIRGAIWYQGESDAGMVDEYRTLFASLVASWRDRWNDPKLPVYYVQLPNFIKPPPSWAPFRQMQLELLDTIPNIGMAVTIDIGNPNDIHPSNKYDVGQRLARQALYNTYGRKDIGPSGPLPGKAVRNSGNRVVLSWKWSGAGLKTSDGKSELLSFKLAGPDGVFHPAEAKISSVDTVEISCPAVANPVQIQYAYDVNPAVNLINSDNLPASPCVLRIEN